MPERERAKKLIGGISSWAADKVYEPLVVNGAFKLFGGRLNNLVREQGLQAAAFADGRPILDLPVGTGTFTINAARATSGLIVGCDIAEGMVRQTVANAAAERVTNLAGVRADAHRLPFPDGAFAAVLCTNGLQVMPGLMQTLSELRRVLAADGKLYVSVVSMPISSSSEVPTLVMSRPQLRMSFEAAGFAVASMRKERLATLLEAEPA